MTYSSGYIYRDLLHVVKEDNFATSVISKEGILGGTPPQVHNNDARQTEQKEEEKECQSGLNQSGNMTLSRLAFLVEKPPAFPPGKIPVLGQCHTCTELINPASLVVHFEMERFAVSLPVSVNSQTDQSGRREEPQRPEGQLYHGSHLRNLQLSPAFCLMKLMTNTL